MFARLGGLAEFPGSVAVLNALAVALLLLFAEPTCAAPPRALAVGEQPADTRLGPLKDLNGYFPFQVPETATAWQERSTALRRQVLVSQGLWPMPTRLPLEPVVHGRVEQDDYTIEKVYFESMPGLYVTGNLYRPKERAGKSPGVLCPHGHWANGRFYDCGEQEVRKQITQEAERFEDGGRSPMQSRCVQLARMGCVVFHYDMLGYADSQQIPSTIIHGFKKQRPEMNATSNWGLFSPQAESRLQSPMGLQTFNSIRSLDFLTSLPDVDSSRIAVTGASGGGTQTFVLGAIDARVKVAFPAVMVSTAMQGGCTCENACCLRTGTGNIELAALFAPKPLGMTAANDWTVNMPTKGFPELQQLFKLLGAPNDVALTALPHFGHNYNFISRAAMYGWLNKYLHLNVAEPIVEKSYQRMSKEQLTVWDNQHPAPAEGPSLERKVVRWWTDDSNEQLDALLTKDHNSRTQYQQLVLYGVDAVVGRPLPQIDHLNWRVVSKQEQTGYQVHVGLLTYRLPPRLASAANQAGTTEDIQEQLPLLLLQPASPSGRVCVLALPQGKGGLYDKHDRLRPPIQRLLKAGVTVCAADLMYQGEFLKEGQTVETTRHVENPREAAAYTFGYNPTLFARRVHDLLTVLAMFDQPAHRADQLDLVGLGEAGPWAAVARLLAGQRVTRLAVDNADFRFAHVKDLHDPAFLPGAAKYDDLPGILAAAAPQSVWLATGTETLPPPIRQIYQAQGRLSDVTQFAGAQSTGTRFTGTQRERLDAIVAWLLEE